VKREDKEKKKMMFKNTNCTTQSTNLLGPGEKHGRSEREREDQG
jgi:hypothetical protein